MGGEDCPVKVSSSVFASVFEKAFDDSNNNLVDSQDREQKQDRKQFLQPKWIVSAEAGLLPRWASAPR